MNKYWMRFATREHGTYLAASNHLHINANVEIVKIGNLMLTNGGKMRLIHTSTWRSRTESRERERETLICDVEACMYVKKHTATLWTYRQMYRGSQTALVRLVRCFCHALFSRLLLILSDKFVVSSFIAADEPAYETSIRSLWIDDETHWSDGFAAIFHKVIFIKKILRKRLYSQQLQCKYFMGVKTSATAATATTTTTTADAYDVHFAQILRKSTIYYRATAARQTRWTRTKIARKTPHTAYSIVLRLNRYDVWTLGCMCNVYIYLNLLPPIFPHPPSVSFISGLQRHSFGVHSSSSKNINKMFFQLGEWRLYCKGAIRTCVHLINVRL